MLKTGKNLNQVYMVPLQGNSVVVPSYNEENLLPLMMDEAVDYLKQRQKQDPSFTYEFIVVNDGSKDQTTKGVFSSREKKILMADADRATKFADIEKVEEGLKNLQPWPRVVDKVQAWDLYCNRRIAGLIFSASLDVLIILNVFMSSTSLFGCSMSKRSRAHCGFKLLTREAALQTFSTLHRECRAFDVELLYIAQRLKIPIAELAVNWTEIEGSKLVEVWSWLQMGRDLLFIRLRYMTGAWQLERRKYN